MADTNASSGAAVDKSSMQVALANASSALTMPQEEFVEFYCQPIQDDTWIRHEEIVKMEDIVETEGGEAIKKEILKEYIEERVRTGQTAPADPILEGMLAQEQFMQEYQMSGRGEDKDRAIRYRQQLVSNFRRKNPAPEVPPAPFGEEDVDLDADSADEEEKGDEEAAADAPRDVQYPMEEVPAPEATEPQPQAETEYPTEEASPAAETQPPAETEYPTEESTAAAVEAEEQEPERVPEQAEAEPEELEEPQSAEAAKTASVAPSPKAADSTVIQNEERAAAQVEAFADEL